MKLAKSDKGSYYNQGKWVSEHEYGKGQYCSGELEAESHNDSVLHKMFFGKEKNILVSLEKLSTFANAFTVYKFCNKPIQVEEDNDKSVDLACF